MPSSSTSTYALPDKRSRPYGVKRFEEEATVGGASGVQRQIGCELGESWTDRTNRWAPVGRDKLFTFSGKSGEPFAGHTAPGHRVRSFRLLILARTNRARHPQPQPLNCIHPFGWLSSAVMSMPSVSQEFRVHQAGLLGPDCTDSMVDSIPFFRTHGASPQLSQPTPLAARKLMPNVGSPGHKDPVSKSWARSRM